METFATGLQCCRRSRLTVKESLNTFASQKIWQNQDLEQMNRQCSVQSLSKRKQERTAQQVELNGASDEVRMRLTQATSTLLRLAHMGDPQEGIRTSAKGCVADADNWTRKPMSAEERQEPQKEGQRWLHLRSEVRDSSSDESRSPPQPLYTAHPLCPI